MSDAELYQLTVEGRAALTRLDRDAAEAAFQQALDERPDFVDARVGLGQVAFERGDVPEASRQFARAVQLAERQHGGRWPTTLRVTEPHEHACLRAIHGVALVAYRQGKITDALRFLTLEQRLDPQDHQGARYLVRNIRAKKPWAAT